jgi:hypothetical protein
VLAGDGAGVIARLENHAVERLKEPHVVRNCGYPLASGEHLPMSASGRPRTHVVVAASDGQLGVCQNGP